MRLISLLLWVIAANVSLGSALAQPAPPSAPAETSVGAAAKADCGGQPFVPLKAKYLAPDSLKFQTNFTDANRVYQGPKAGDSIPPASPEAVRLDKAFQLAPQWLQIELCTQVDTVYVDPISYPDSEFGGWAFWESTKQNGGKLRFIGISRETLTSDGLLLSQSEGAIVRGLLLQGQNPIFTTNPSTFPFVSVTLNDAKGKQVSETPEWAVLAILAHEMGHLFWHQICAKGGDQVNQKGCNRVFHRIGWDNLGGPWHLREFGASIDGATHPKEALPPYTPDELKSDRWPYTRLQELYQGDTWPDLFADIAPDEDIAETYKLMALQEAKEQGTGTFLKSLEFIVPDVGGAGGWNSGNILDNLKTGILAVKGKVLKDCVPRPPSSSCHP